MPVRSDATPRGIPRPTPAGGAAALVGLTATILGLLLGLGEITGLGLALVTLVVLAVASAGVGASGLRAERTVTPDRATAGDLVEVGIRVLRGRRDSGPRVTLIDHVHGPGGRSERVRRTIGPWNAPDGAAVSYRFRVDRRGIFDIGPMRIECSDPFGLARRSVAGPTATRVTVLPRIEVVDPPSFVVDAGSDTTSASILAGSEFAALRDYVPGDDLRKVHWRTSARRDSLVIRRDEQPRRNGCTVLVDVRPTAPDTDDFERVVSAAASILVTTIRAGQPSRLCTTAGFDSGSGTGADHLDLVLGTLAVLGAGPPGIVTAIRDPDPLIVITTATGAASLHEPGGLPVHPTLSVVFASTDGTVPTTPTTTDGRTMTVTASESFGDVWNRVGASVRTRIGIA